jgi:hypothetical protein
MFQKSTKFILKPSGSKEPENMLYIPLGSLKKCPAPETPLVKLPGQNRYLLFPIPKLRMVLKSTKIFLDPPGSKEPKL